MEMIQNAYAGFAKGNMTMLDNLKLGYGGTKEEMARLIEEAAAMTDVQKELGIAVDATDMSFGNIVNAISVVQKNMKITGTTADEAGRTIAGSVQSMKSAWTNLLTGLADGNADIEGLINNLVTTIVGDGTENNLGVLGNIMPAVKMALKGAAKVVAQSAPIIAEELPKLMEEILPDLASATANLIVALAEQIPSMAQTLVDAAYQIVDEIGNAFAERIPGLSAIFENLETVVISLTAAFVAYKAATAISEIIDTLRKATEGQTIAQTLLNAVMNANPFVLVATLIASVGTALVTLYMTNEDFRDKVTAAWSTVKDTISNVISALKTFFTTTLPNAIDTAVDWLENLPDKFREVGANLLEGLWNGINDKVEWLKGKVSGVVNTIKEWFTGKDGFDVHSPSRVFATIGEFVIEGLAIGMENSKGEVMETAKDIIDDVKERFSSLPNVLTAIQDQSAEDAAALDKFSQSAKNAFSAFEGFGDSLRDVGELIGSDIVSGIGEIIDDMTSGVSTVLNFAASLATLTETITTLKEAMNALKASEGIAGIVSSIGNMLGIGAAGAAAGTAAAGTAAAGTAAAGTAAAGTAAAGTAGAAAAGGAGILAVVGEVLSGPVGWALLAAGAIGAIGLGIAAATKNKNVSSTAQGAGNAIDYRDIQDAYWHGNNRAFAGYDFSTDPYIYRQRTSAMNSYQQRMHTQIERLTDLVQEYLPQTANMQMVLDDGTLVGALTPSINSQLGQLEILAERGNI